MKVHHRTRLHPRLLIAPLFLIALIAGYRSAAQTAGGVPSLRLTRTEEGQLVAFNRTTYVDRELSKLLPLDEPWPAGADHAKVLARFGLDRNAPPERQPMPSRIIGDVYLVGQGVSSNLTYMVDCGAEGVAVIDPSYDSEMEQTLANIESCGRSRKDIRWVINTHCHTDHSLADAKFHQLGAQILLHEADANAIEQGTRVTAFDRYHLPEFPRCPVARRLSDGEILRLGNKQFEVIHTPGHTPGSMSLLLKAEGKNLLFSGDTVFFDSMLGWQGNPYADNRQYLASVKKLEHFTLDAQPVRWDLLLPGHTTIVFERAYLDVQKARERIEFELGAGRELLTPPYTPEYRKRMFGRPRTTMAAPQNE